MTTATRSPSRAAFADDVTLFDEDMDDLEAWAPQDLDEFDSFSVSRLADLAE